MNETQPVAPAEPMRSHAASVGLNFEDVKTGLRRLLPIMKTIASLTPNKVDDAAVAFVESIVNQ